MAAVTEGLYDSYYYETIAVVFHSQMAILVNARPHSLGPGARSSWTCASSWRVGRTSSASRSHSWTWATSASLVLTVRYHHPNASLVVIS